MQHTKANQTCNYQASPPLPQLANQKWHSDKCSSKQTAVGRPAVAACPFNLLTTPPDLASPIPSWCRPNNARPCRVDKKGRWKALQSGNKRGPHTTSACASCSTNEPRSCQQAHPSKTSSTGINHPPLQPKTICRCRPTAKSQFPEEHNPAIVCLLEILCMDIHVQNLSKHNHRVWQLTHMLPSHDTTHTHSHTKMHDA